jgi:predicted P-loop ATPase/GTPase
MPDYRFIGNCAKNVLSGDKIIPVAPGDYITLNAEDYQQAVETYALELVEAPGGAPPPEEG